MKRLYDKGEHALTYYPPGDAFVTTPLRIARREMLVFGIMLSLHNSVEDCNTMADYHNGKNFGQFIGKAMNKLEARWKVEEMFNRPGLIH